MASHYNLPSTSVKSKPVSGQSLALLRKDRIQRAFVAADLYSGATRLVAPTQRQAAVLAKVDRTAVYWASKRLAERSEIEAGRIPLVPARTNGNSEHITDDELALIARIVGPDRMLEAAIAVGH